MMKPVVKWVGGKSKLLDIIDRNLPKRYNRLIEPFVGGGSVFLHLDSKIINDKNTQLINLYIQIKNNPEKLIELLDKIETQFNDLDDNEKSKFYYSERDKFNETILLQLEQLTVEDASRFIFLNKTCFNGLYRVNQNGLFNVPYNKKTKISLYDKTNILNISKQLQHTQIYNEDFEFLEALIEPGDLVFVDSPYFDTYDNYNNNGFTKNDHLRLFNFVERLTKKNVYVLMTNSNSDYIKNLYASYNIQVIDSIHSINRVGTNRRKQEVIIKNW